MSVISIVPRGYPRHLPLCTLLAERLVFGEVRTLVLFLKAGLLSDRGEVGFARTYSRGFTIAEVLAPNPRCLI